MVLLASIPMLVQGFTRSKTISCHLRNQCHPSHTTFQILNKPLAVPQDRVAVLEAGAAAASSGARSARSWNILGRTDGSTATGSQVQDLLMTTGISDADLILSRTQMMKMLEVPSYFSFRVNKSTLECLLGSMKSEQPPTYQLSTDLSGFIVKQASNPPDSYLKQEPSVKT